MQKNGHRHKDRFITYPSWAQTRLTQLTEDRRHGESDIENSNLGLTLRESALIFFFNGPHMNY